MILFAIRVSQSGQSLGEFQKTPEQIVSEIQQKLNLLCVHSPDGNVYDVIVQPGGFDFGGSSANINLETWLHLLRMRPWRVCMPKLRLSRLKDAGYDAFDFLSGRRDFKKYGYRYEVVAGDVTNRAGSQEHGCCAGRRCDRRPGRFCRVHVHARDKLGGRADHFARDGRFVFRRQNGIRPARRQEPDRLFPFTEISFGRSTIA